MPTCLEDVKNQFYTTESQIIVLIEVGRSKLLFVLMVGCIDKLNNQNQSQTEKYFADSQSQVPEHKTSLLDLVVSTIMKCQNSIKYMQKQTCHKSHNINKKVYQKNNHDEKQQHYN
jgi:hypothetical protein